MINIKTFSSDIYAPELFGCFCHPKGAWHERELASEISEGILDRVISLPLFLQDIHELIYTHI